MVAAALERVGLTTAHLDRRPSAVSGGELARVVLARALLLAPQVLVLDEPTASLDARTTRTIVELLLLAPDRARSHDPRHHARDPGGPPALRHDGGHAVGRIVEAGPTAKVLNTPCSAYTRAPRRRPPRPPAPGVGAQLTSQPKSSAQATFWWASSLSPQLGARPRAGWRAHRRPPPRTGRDDRSGTPGPSRRRGASPRGPPGSVRATARSAATRVPRDRP